MCVVCDCMCMCPCVLFMTMCVPVCVVYNCMYVCMCLCVCVVCDYECVCTCMCVVHVSVFGAMCKKGRGGYLMSCSVALHLIPLKQSLSLNLGFALYPDGKPAGVRGPAVSTLFSSSTGHIRICVGMPGMLELVMQGSKLRSSPLNGKLFSSRNCSPD